MRVSASLAVSASLLVVAPGVAHADEEWRWADGFESNPWQTWTQTGTGYYEYGAKNARSGSVHAVLPTNDDWASVGITLPVPARIYSGSDHMCSASVWVRTLPENGLTTSTVNFEIIDEPTWAYMALTTRTIPAGSWQKLSVGPWSSGDETPHLRVSLLAGSAPLRVDDAEVYCTGWEVR